jgi:type III restriction enzyme
MPAETDRQRFRNEELVLQVTTAADRAKWDESHYEAFLDELCGPREYQKEAIRTALRFLIGGEYKNLRDLATKNFEQSSTIASRYGTILGLEHHLQLPTQLSASLDLATGTGKSYVMYGIAAIMLSEGAVDRVLVLCPSVTIEFGLVDKFKDLAGNSDLRDALPPNAKIATPLIINANQTIVEGAICIENYHAILEHVGSSIREGLNGRGSRVLVLNDEAHHVANETDTQTHKWKQFLQSPEFGFNYIIGLSGTCYVGNEYFSDVIYRYSLRQAMEENYVKRVDYVTQGPSTTSPDDKWQVVNNRHGEIRKKLKNHKLRPLTIVVTSTIARCKDLGEEIKGFLVEHTGIDGEKADEQVLVVHNRASDLSRLPYVDNSNSKVEWIVAVSMLNEGWDVKRVFQIVPHEERAFNSKLLISQVLGRGLRVPDGWEGEQPVVTVFNHDAWAAQIRELVEEILEIEKRLVSEVLPDSPYHFDLLNIDYTLEPTSVKKPMTGEYTMLAKGYVDLATDSPSQEVSVEYERAATGERYTWKTQVQHKTFSVAEIAQVMFERLEEAQDPNDSDPKMRTVYTDQFPIHKLEQVVKESLKRVGCRSATEGMRQKFLQALGPLRRKQSENVRYTPIVNRYKTVTTKSRQAISASAVEFRTHKTIFYTEKTKFLLSDEEIEFFNEVTEPGSSFKSIKIPNYHDFKTPLNLAIAEFENERRFMYNLVDHASVGKYDAWIKSAPVRFYDIDYAWKKGEHPKRGKFSPDFFIKVGNLIVVVEVKGNEELLFPSEENRKKNEYALAHFDRINEHLKQEESPIRYKLTFLTESSFAQFFQSMRDGTLAKFRSELDVKLAQE